jgi:hypothetical protein
VHRVAQGGGTLATIGDLPGTHLPRGWVNRSAPFCGDRTLRFSGRRYLDPTSHTRLVAQVLFPKLAL